MKLIINTSNIHVGGPLQVALSFIHELIHFQDHEYHVFLSPEVQNQLDQSRFPSNFVFYSFRLSASLSSLRRKWMSYQRNRRMTLLERVIMPDAVFSVFGPTYWHPRAPHVAGFAIPFFIYKESPYFRVIGRIELMKRQLINQLRSRLFIHYTDYLVVETEEVRQRLMQAFNVSAHRIHNVSNTLNSVYDHPKAWSDRIILPQRQNDEIRLVTISANHSYKNLKIINQVINELLVLRPGLKLKFILSFREQELRGLSKSNRKYVHFTGPLKIDECPYLYQQCDFMFLPSLLDCFSASYPEAMKMGLPILTSNLSFARNVCGDAALYFDPLNAREIAEKIIYLADSPLEKARMVAHGRRKLIEFGTAHDRAENYLELAEKAIRIPLMKQRGLHSEFKEPVLS